MYGKKKKSVMSDALLILLFIPFFFFNMQACESWWKVEEPASLLGIQIPIAAVSRGPPGMC